MSRNAKSGISSRKYGMANPVDGLGHDYAIAARHGGDRFLSSALALGACAFAVYGINATLQHATT